MPPADVAAQQSRGRTEAVAGVCALVALVAFVVLKLRQLGPGFGLAVLGLALVVAPVLGVVLVRAQRRHEHPAAGDLWRGGGAAGRQLGVMVLRPDGLCWEPLDVWRGPRPDQRLVIPLDELTCVELGPPRRSRPWQPPVARVRVNRRAGPPLVFDLRHTGGLAAALGRLRPPA